MLVNSALPITAATSSMPTPGVSIFCYFSPSLVGLLTLRRCTFQTSSSGVNKERSKQIAYAMSEPMATESMHVSNTHTVHVHKGPSRSEGIFPALPLDLTA